MRRLGQFARYKLQGKTLKTWKRSRSICPGTVFTSCVSGGYVEVFIYPVNFSWRNEWKCNIPVNSWTNTHLVTKLWLELRSDSMKTTDTLNSWSKSRIFQHSFSVTGIAVNFFSVIYFHINCNDFSFLFRFSSLTRGNYWLQSAVHFWLENITRFKCWVS